MELPWTYSMQAKPINGNGVSKCIHGKKQKGCPCINIATVTKKYNERKWFSGTVWSQDKKLKTEKSGEGKLNKYVTRSSRTI